MAMQSSPVSNSAVFNEYVGAGFGVAAVVIGPARIRRNAGHRHVGAEHAATPPTSESVKSHALMSHVCAAIGLQHHRGAWCRRRRDAVLDGFRPHHFFRRATVSASLRLPGQTGSARAFTRGANRPPMNSFGR
jgi:hypothetical protein